MFLKSIVPILEMVTVKFPRKSMTKTIGDSILINLLTQSPPLSMQILFILFNIEI